MIATAVAAANIINGSVTPGKIFHRKSFSKEIPHQQVCRIIGQPAGAYRGNASISALEVSH